MRRVLDMARRGFLIQAKQARKLAPELWGLKGVEATVKLFHREERPAPERYIVDTSEWTCANHRHVMGQHFLTFGDIRVGSANLQLFAKYFPRLCLMTVRNNHWSKLFTARTRRRVRRCKQRCASGCGTTGTIGEPGVRRTRIEPGISVRLADLRADSPLSPPQRVQTSTNNIGRTLMSR